MAIIAAFTNGINEVTVNGLYQWDYGQTLMVQASDLPAVAEVHFANKLHETAVVRAAVMNTDLTSMTVAIPDELLEDPYDITAYVYYCGAGYANTAKIIHLPISRRAKPSSVFDPVTPSEQTQFENMMTQINNVVGEINTAVNACTAEINKIKDGTTIVSKAAKLGVFLPGATDPATGNTHIRAKYTDMANEKVQLVLVNGLNEDGSEKEHNTISVHDADEATRAGYLNWYYNGNKVNGHHILAKRPDPNGADVRLVLVAEGTGIEYNQIFVRGADTAVKVETVSKTLDAWSSDGIVAGLYAFIISNSSGRQTIMLSVFDLNQSVESIGGSYNGNYNAYTVRYEPAVTEGAGVPASFLLVLNGSTAQGRCIEARLITAY